MNLHWVDCPECGGDGVVYEEDGDEMDCPNCCGTGGDYVDLDEEDKED